jgi:hypothetical protein
MRKPDRRLTRKLALNREIVRTLTRVELAAVGGGDALADSTDPCTWVKRVVVPSNVPCG